MSTDPVLLPFQSHSIGPQLGRGDREGRHPPPALILFLLGFAHAAYADDLEAGVSDAATRFKKLIKTGVAVAALVIVVMGLMVTGFKFSQKDPGAIWYLAGTAAGGALFGVAAAML
jgi:hypothetical protein